MPDTTNRISFACPHCSRTHAVAAAHAGKKAKCSGCSKVISVPAVTMSAEPDSYDVDDAFVSAPLNPMVPFPPLDVDGSKDADDLADSPIAASSPPPPSRPSAPIAANFSAAGSDATRRGMTATQGYILIGLILVGLGAPVLGSLRPTPKWEYRIESPSDLSFEDEIKKLGDQGWELVTARRASSEYKGASYEMIFKRPK